ncbi:MAG: nitroreductase family protein [Calditrichaeota bacterium]|nr:MAG: nitroreductase family protein [Calditrichota bacterium]MBL1207929.1 nitroreductase family protein [Calditrichota bacterium]NOG47764.1 nitroreductase family protein [Calditrichota bacterium]
MQERSEKFYSEINKRRSIRDFSDEAVDNSIIENCIKSAGTAPSGAHLQPWHFVAVSNSEIKKKIREAAEKEEYEFYHGRASEEWLDDLKQFKTNEHKPFLETAPWLIAIFEKRYGLKDEGEKKKHYYVTESVGIATGMLITAIHNAGLVCLTHTPSPMKFLNEILQRPVNEKPFLLLVVGHPAKGAMVPDNKRKDINEIATFL